jgi:hypothetical protein
MVLPCIKYPDYHVVYVAPTGHQASVFSTDKLDSAMRNSEFIQRYYTDTKTKDQVMYKEFRGGSKIYLRSAFHSADSTRGITADQTDIDELQDILTDHIPVIEQCMSHSLPKWESMKERIPDLPMHLFNKKMYSGTPKTIENTLERYWAKSTKNEWLIKCLHCNRWNYINEQNVGPDFLICNKCGLAILYKDGLWVAMNPGADIQGYRLPQVILPWINNQKYPEIWKVNIIHPMKIYTSQKFFNEVLALPYANAKNPLNEFDIRATCKEDFEMALRPDSYPWLKNMELFAGIDWGKGDLATGTSYSVLWIGGPVNGKYRSVFVRKYVGRMSEPLVQIQDMLHYINFFKCNFTIADSGDGRTANAMLVEKLGPHRFSECYEHGTMKRRIKWDPDQGIYIINRTRMMTDLFMQIKRGDVEFFKYEQFKVYAEDFLNIYTEYSEQTRQTRYDHSGPDDCFHAFMFSRLACMIIKGELGKYLGTGENEELELN